VPTFGHGNEHEGHGKVHFGVLRTFSVAESLGSPPSLERHYKMRFSAVVGSFQWAVCSASLMNAKQPLIWGQMDVRFVKRSVSPLEALPTTDCPKQNRLAETDIIG
jgi:hypothetical protein